MDKKKISTETVAKRMNRILAAYAEQLLQEQADGITPRASTSSSSSQSSCASSSSQANSTTERKMELDKAILNYATAQIDNDSESDSDSDFNFSDQSYSFTESPPKRRCQSSKFVTVGQPSKRRRQPSRTVKEAATKLTTFATKRPQRKVTCTVTSKSSSNYLNSSSDSSVPDMIVTLPESDDSDADTKPIKTRIVVDAMPKAKRVPPM